MNEKLKNSNNNIPNSGNSDFISTYENYTVDCPICKQRNLYNRISDIKSIGMAMGKNVICNYCHKPFIIQTDKVNELYEYFIDECDELMKQKRYMQCIILLCQACEAFIMKCIEIQLLWKPYRNGIFGLDNNKYKLFEEFYKLIHDKFLKFPYKKEVNIFIDIYCNNLIFKNQDEIRKYIEIYIDDIKELKDNDIIYRPNEIQSNILLEIKKFDINNIRNKIIHKEAFRPRYDDVIYYRENVKRLINKVIEVFELKDLMKYSIISSIIDLIGKVDNSAEIYIGE